MKLFSRLILPATLLLATFSVSPIATAQTASVKSPSWIQVQATTDKDKYAPGEPIQVTLKATNIVKRDAYLKYSSGQRFELKLFKATPFRSNGAREPVYTWSADKSFLMMVSHVRLRPGQSEIYQGEINSELTPGLYRLEAQLTNSSGIRAAPVNFRVVAGAPSAGAEKVTLRATTDKRVYDLGEPVTVNFSIQNNTASPQTFEFNSGQTYDVVVRDAAGETVWNWALPRQFTMATRQVTLQAGEKRDYSVQWDGRVLLGRKIEPGQYTIEAVYTANPAVRAAPVPIEIR